MYSVTAQDYESWRQQARRLLQAGIHPAQVMWNENSAQAGLFASQSPPEGTLPTPNVPKNFLALAEVVCCHRHPERFHLLYHMLWRLLFEDRNLLRISSDPLTHMLFAMQQSVRRDVHKTKAFVRFRSVRDESEQEHFIAWHKPDHYSLRLSAPFFARRFAAMRWAILTPDESVAWNGQELLFGPGASAEDAPQHDDMENLWRSFYRSIFNPARLNIRMMKKEMPVRHWATLPETEIIHEMLKKAPQRVAGMTAHSEGAERSAADFLPERFTLPALRQASEGCRGCELYKCATQTVFGEGSAHARLMLIGEQPGDEEDKHGKPFIGPAGQMLDRALADAGIERESCYVTNAVKHFKFSVSAGRRLHRTPSLREITGCKPWLEAELLTVKPKIVMCLGASAGKAIIGPGFTLKEYRGKVLHKDAYALLATYHPSAVLRSPEPEQMYQMMVDDLKRAKVQL